MRFCRELSDFQEIGGPTISEQIIAVNVDIVFLVMSMNHDFNARRLERYLVAAYDSGATPVVVLTKMDLCDDPDHYLELARAIAFGTDVFPVSNTTGEGIEQITDMLKNGKTAALLGSSGSGKIIACQLDLRGWNDGGARHSRR